MKPTTNDFDAKMQKRAALGHLDQEPATSFDDKIQRRAELGDRERVTRLDAESRAALAAPPDWDAVMEKRAAAGIRS